MKLLSRVFKKRRKKNRLIAQLKKQHFILNPEEVAEQILNKSAIIQYNYKNQLLHINNEKSALYHLINSTGKLEKLVDEIDLNECGTVLDIGANTGLFTYFIKKKFPDAVVYLFEPDERLYPIIEKNIKGFSNCFIIPFAVGDTDNEEVSFYINSNSAQTNSTIKEAVTVIDTKAEIIIKKIETITIDTFCSEHSITDIDVLKIDIQGGELKAFTSASEILLHTKIVFAEISFCMDDTIEMLALLKTYFKKYKAINQVLMGADLKFFNY